MRKGGADDEAPTFVPTREWLDAYLAQSTGDLLKYAKRYARKQARKVALVRYVDETYANDMVQDVVGDTLLGAIAWDPERVSLKKHVLDAIKSRTRHDYVHAKRFRQVRLDASSGSLAAEVESTLADAKLRGEEIARVSGEVIDALRALATGDHDVMLLLDALAKLVTKKLDITNLTGLTSKRYAAARRRMHRLTLQLPASLRRAAIGRE